jgi:hypothetical protein
VTTAPLPTQAPPTSVIEPDAPSTSTADDVIHVVCCDPDLTLCGKDVTEGSWFGAEEPATCNVCRVLDANGRGCLARFCQIRQWWRDRFGRRR